MEGKGGKEIGSSSSSSASLLEDSKNVTDQYESTSGEEKNNL